MHRDVMNGILFSTLALILPACGSANSGAPGGTSGGADPVSAYGTPSLSVRLSAVPDVFFGNLLVTSP